VIERLLAAERALESDQLELADRLFAQVAAADPRNAIAMTGRAKVARRQGDLDAARRHVARALETDPEDAAARALATALATEIATSTSNPEPTAPLAAPPATPPPSEPMAAASPPSQPLAAAPMVPAKRGGLLAWLRRVLLRRD